MHDDRITRVTFEENTSRNALIVNEEYAWVGNPFSAPRGGKEKKRRTFRHTLFSDTTFVIRENS